MAATLKSFVNSLLSTLTADELQDQSDADLLGRFLADRDRVALEALVIRHGPRVLAAARRVLVNSADADDVFQATFLTLLRSARGVRRRKSVGSWLAGVAHRLALKSVRSAARSRRREQVSGSRRAADDAPDLSWPEAVAVLHEELDNLPDRFRLPLLLCYLEGLSRDEAARQLGWKPGSVKAGLERGRQRLRDRLTRRGITLSAGLLAVVAGTGWAAEGPRLALVQLTLDAATGTASPSVAALIDGASPMVLTGKKLMAALALSITLLGTALGFRHGEPAATEQSGPPRLLADKGTPDGRKADPPKPSEKRIAGRVLDPNGKPVSGATLALGGWDMETETQTSTDLAKTDEDGRFKADVPAAPGHRDDYRTLVARAPGFGPDWVEVGRVQPDREVTLRLVKADVSVQGRALNLEGKPVPGATVRLLVVSADDGKNGLKQVYARWPGEPEQAANLLQKRLGYPTAAGFPETVKADAEGRFEIKGIGDGRLASLEISGEPIEKLIVRVAVDADFDPKAILPDPAKADPRGLYSRAAPPLYGPKFDHAAAPCRVVTGTITDRKTGKPLANAGVTGRVRGGYWENHTFARTDAEGRYRLLGLPNKECELSFHGGKGRGYLGLSASVQPTEGLTPAKADMALERGVVVTGRVVDKPTGKPIKGNIRFATLSGNPALAKLPGREVHEHGVMTYDLDKDGRFRVIAPPGPGIILVQAAPGDEGVRPYPQVRLKKDDRGKPYFGSHDGLGESFRPANGTIHPLIGFHAYAVVEPKDGQESVSADFELIPGKSVAGSVVGPDGKACDGAMLTGLSAAWEDVTTLKGSVFQAHALVPDAARTVAAIHMEKRLGGTAQVSVDANEPTVKLAAWGVVAGRIVDQDGKPVAGAGVRVQFVDQSAATLHGRLTEYRSVSADADGNFRVDVPLGDSKFRLLIDRKGKFLVRDNWREEYVVPSGKTRDLGNVAVKVED